MATQGPASCPTPRPAESCDLKALPARQRPLHYHKESCDLKAPAHSCKAQYSSLKPQEGDHSSSQKDAEVEGKQYSNNDADIELKNQHPETPPLPEHNHEDHDEADFHGGADSLDDDSSSDYINNSSDDEEDYDDGEFDVSFQGFSHTVLLKSVG